MVVFSLLLLHPSHVSYAADKWRAVRSRNFLLVGNASESSIKRVARELEEFREAFSTVFPAVRQRSPIGTTVIVFRDDDSFRPYKPLYRGKAGNVAGYFAPGQDVNFIALTADRESSHVIYHEFVHSLMKDMALPLPAWAGEGFAEVYGMFQISGREMIIGRAIGEHIAVLTNERMLPLRELLAVDHDSPHYNEESKQGIFYAQSWATVHYLLFGAGGQRRQQLTTYLNLTSNGKTIDENFQQAFQTDFRTIEEEIRKYLEQRVAWPAIKVRLSEQLNFDREMQTSNVSEAEAQYYLGDLLLHMDRLQDAEAHLRKALALDANLDAAYASLGMLRMREGKSPEALEFFTKAVERDSKNHLAHYYYAYMLQRTEAADAAEQRSRWDRTRTHARKATELAPHFVEGYSLLGYVALVSKEGVAEAEDALIKAIQYAPGRLELRIRLAELLFAGDKLADAEFVLTTVTNSGAEPAIRSQAERLLDAVRNRRNAEQALREYEERRRRLNESPARATSEDRTRPSPGPSGRLPDGAAASDIVETARPKREAPQGPRLQGLLTDIDCSKGLTLRLKVNGVTVELHTDAPNQVEFVSYVAAVKDAIDCGPVKPEVHVEITYRRAADPRFLGEPLRVDFVDPK